MEPLNGTALVTADRVDLWHPAAMVLQALVIATEETGVPAENIHFHQTLVGGSFGRRVNCDDVRMVVAVARKFPGHADPRDLVARGDLPPGQVPRPARRAHARLARRRRLAGGLHLARGRVEAGDVRHERRGVRQGLHPQRPHRDLERRDSTSSPASTAAPATTRIASSSSASSMNAPRAPASIRSSTACGC